MNKLLPSVLLAVAMPAFAAETYTLDSHHTFPRFAISHLGLSTFRAQFDDTQGTVTLDRAKKTGSVEATIAVASIATGVDKLDEHLKSADFFDAAKYPTISFKASDFSFDGDTPSAVTGTLTMHGVAKPVTLTIGNFVCKEHPMMKKPACGAELSGTLKRSDWGISTYVPLVGDEVTLTIEVEALAP